jgi:hypothetical protein
VIVEPGPRGPNATAAVGWEEITVQTAETKRVELPSRGQTTRNLVISLVLAAALTVAGAGTGVALYRLYPVQTSLFVAWTSNYVRSWLSPQGETTTKTSATDRSSLLREPDV